MPRASASPRTSAPDATRRWDTRGPTSKGYRDLTDLPGCPPQAGSASPCTGSSTGRRSLRRSHVPRYRSWNFSKSDRNAPAATRSAAADTSNSSQQSSQWSSSYGSGHHGARDSSRKVTRITGSSLGDDIRRNSRFGSVNPVVSRWSIRPTRLRAPWSHPTPDDEEMPDARGDQAARRPLGERPVVRGLRGAMESPRRAGVPRLAGDRAAAPLGGRRLRDGHPDAGDPRG